MHGAVGLKALEDALAEVDGQGVVAVGRLGMHRARPTPLLARTVELLEQSQVAQHLFQGDLPAQEGVVHAGSRCRRWMSN